MNATQQIMNAIADMMAEQDAQIVKSQVEWALQRKQQLAEFIQQQRNASISERLNIYELYARRFEIAGGKTMHRILNENNNTGVEQIITNRLQKNAEARNAKIAAKLIKNDVQQVESAEVLYCQDGFTGRFKINGNRYVYIEVILAGGHNIQCRHQRVLVRIK